MTLKEFFSVFESSHPFQNYLNQYYPSSELQKQSKKLKESPIEGDYPFDWSLSFDNLAIHLSDDEFKSLFEQIEQSLDEDKKEDFFDYFNRLITQTGYKGRFEEEQSAVIHEEESFDALAMRLESGRRISWLLDWVAEQHSAYIIKNDLPQGFLPMFNWVGQDKKFAELIAYLVIKGWIEMPEGLSKKSVLVRHFMTMVGFPDKDKNKVMNNLADYFKKYDLDGLTESKLLATNTFSEKEMAFRTIKENKE